MSRRVLGCLLCLPILLAELEGAAQQPVYRWVDANGVVHFSDTRPAESAGVAAEAIVLAPTAPAAREVGTPTRSRVARAAANDASAAPAAPDAASPSVQPPSCSTTSPMKDSGRDLYETNDSPPQPLPASAIESFATVVESMRGRWSGTAVGFSCNNGNSTPINRTITAEGNISAPLNLLVQATLAQRGSSHIARLRIEIREQQLRVNSSAATLFAASDRTLEFGHRVLGGDAKEFYWRIYADGRRTVQIEQRTYANGTLIETSLWELEKPF